MNLACGDLRFSVCDPIAEDTDRARYSGSQFESAGSIASAIMTRLGFDDERAERPDCRAGCGGVIDVNGRSGPIDQRAGIDRVQRAVGHRWNARLRRTGGANCQLSIQVSTSGRVGLHAAHQHWRQQQDRRPDGCNPRRATRKLIARDCGRVQAFTCPTVAEASKLFSCGQLRRSSGCRAASRPRSASRRQRRRPASGDSRPALCANHCWPPHRSQAGADRW